MLKTFLSFFLYHGLVAGLAFQAMTCTAASTNVDAGSLLRQNEQERQSPKPYMLPYEKPSPPLPEPESGGDTVLIRGFKFEGNRLIGSDTLTEALVGYTNKELSLAQLKQAANKVMDVYREAGWMARAFLPKQEIADGILQIRIVEAIFAGAVLEGEPPHRVGSQRLLDMAAAVLPKGEAVQSQRVDRALLLMEDLPGVSVIGNLIPGEREGETQLVIRATDDALLSGNFFIDNQGSYSTGAARLGINVSLNSPLQVGDALGINALKSEGSDYLRGSYALPLGYNGWRAGLHVSTLKYDVIAGSLVSANAYGTATTSGLDLSYPLLRTQQNKANWILSYDHKQFDNSANSATTTYLINSINATLSATQLDNWGGGGMNSQSLGWTSGHSTEDGSYHKLNLNISRMQNLAANVTLSMAFSSQFTHQNLDSSEKFYLGGATGVRGYPSGEAGGSEGSILAFELKHRVQNVFTFSVFYDYGWIKVNHDNNISSPSSPNSYELKAHGISATWQPKPNMELKTTLSTRIGSNPVAVNYSGNDSDGTLKQTRVWASVNLAF
jgi:hemolysin activation/secretion protein